MEGKYKIGDGEKRESQGELRRLVLGSKKFLVKFLV